MGVAFYCTCGVYEYVRDAYGDPRKSKVSRVACTHEALILPMRAGMERERPSPNVRLRPSLRLSRLLLFAYVLRAAAHRQYVDRVPNGEAFKPVWKAVGHVAPLPQAISVPGGMAVANVRYPRNTFGVDFSAAGFTWGEALCRKDSDGDGLTNGEELGDPECIWWHGSPRPPSRTNVTLLSHPGIPGEKGRYVNLISYARLLDCRVGVGCQRLGTGAGVTPGKMKTRVTAPAAPVATYHYCFVPVVLLLGLITYLCVPYARPPRWPIVFFEAYLVCHVGVFLGCHRWAAHHAFVASAPLKWIFSILAAWCMQGTPAHWAFLHRLHHRFCDQGILDLQAPRPPHHLIYGHYSWFNTPVEHFFMSSTSNSEAIIPDLMHDPTLPLIGKDISSAIRCHAAILIAIALCYFVSELVRSRRSGVPLRRAGTQTIVKTFVVACWYFWLPCAIAFQIVLLVIDAVHMWGDLAFEDAMSAPCEARNNAFLLLPLLGENWHNNHHSTPHSASTWVWWYQLDVQYLVVRLFELVGLASDVVVAPPSKLRDGYVSEGVFAHVVAEWVALAAIVTTPWWGERLFGHATGHSRKWWSSVVQSASPRDDGNSRRAYAYVPLLKGV